MKKIDLVRKLTSRKFWLSVANFVGMLVVALGGTDNQATQVTALIIAGATVLAYIIGEGLVDAANKVPEGELIELGGAADEKDM